MSEIGVQSPPHSQLYPCPICQNSFANPQLFVLHVVQEHGNLGGFQIKFIQMNKVDSPVHNIAQQLTHNKPTEPQTIIHRLPHSHKLPQTLHPLPNTQSMITHPPQTLVPPAPPQEHTRAQTNVRRQHCSEIGSSNWCNVYGQTHIPAPTVPKQFQCHYCGRTFSKKYNKNVHETIVHKKDYDFKCSICGETFPLKQSLRSHVLRHKGIKPFVCIKCGVGFIENKNLKRHMRSKHDQHCDQCEKVFISKAALRRHHNDCHFIETITEPPIKFEDDVKTTTSSQTPAATGQQVEKTSEPPVTQVTTKAPRYRRMELMEDVPNETTNEGEQSTKMESTTQISGCEISRHIASGDMSDTSDMNGAVLRVNGYDKGSQQSHQSVLSGDLEGMEIKGGTAAQVRRNAGNALKALLMLSNKNCVEV